ncbi:glycoside hydrolase family 5 protein [Pseudonocardia humida]|uniref:Beta-galactosidase-like protein n=1 Tax=Pseudonocardia humida TaxID=2800819 RepID=A0ABT1ABU3_9PSEU|nr:glycoside hydrolase family 5 protein [Pseudonocardia humida]MCO1660269.1 hypothetical protein [Pseudonocardia humida]
MRWPLRALPLALVVVVAGCAQPAAPEPWTTSMAFGVLGATCEPDRLSALRDAGVTVVELPLAWDRFQPAPGEVDQDYAAQARDRLGACRDAGMRVVLAPGLHYPPPWVRELPGGTPRGSSGGRADGVDLVFSATVRDAAADYLARLASDVGFDGVSAVRVGTTSTGELGYPGPTAGGHEREYWASGPAAQSGAGLAEGLTASPLPGWVPGSPVWAGGDVTAEQVDGWFSWYADAPVEAVSWQLDRLRELGFTGRAHVPVAGRGVLPADRAEAVAGLLDGRADPDGALERGLDHPAAFAALAARPDADRIDIDFTGLDDVTAVRARAAGQDRCRPGDEDGLLERADVASWSAQRFTTALARRAGLGLVGENPGPPDAPHTGGAEDSDPLAEQLRLAPAYAVDCGLTTFLFAFEDDLFSGATGVDVADYADRIAASAGRE